MRRAERLRALGLAEAEAEALVGSGLARHERGPQGGLSSHYGRTGIADLHDRFHVSVEHPATMPSTSTRGGWGTTR